jgi:hypothetical protein
LVIVVVGLLAGCGGSGARNDGAAGAGVTGTAGAGGSAVGGSGGSGGAGTCAITTRPADPVNTSGPTCNTVAFGADWVVADPLDPGDGGAVAQPGGGSIIDGDYDLVSFRSSNFGTRRTRRSIRVFDGATYIEWRIDQDDITPDAGVVNYVFDSTSMVSGTDLAMVSVTCGDNAFSSRFGYTAAGSDLLLFQYNSSAGDLQNIFTYRRSCAR